MVRFSKFFLSRNILYTERIIVKESLKRWKNPQLFVRETSNYFNSQKKSQNENQMLQKILSDNLKQNHKN